MRSQPRGGSGSWQQNRGLVWVPVVLILVITLADVMAPQDIHLGPLLIVAPALTASFGGSRLTAAMGALAFGALLAISAARNSIFTANHESQLMSLLLITVFTVIFTRVRERHHAELEQVRSVAEAAQQVVLHPLPERIGALQLASTYQAAADQARIGGDLYAAVRARGGTRLLIGDVRGKGLGAVEDAALLLGAFRSAAHHELPLPELQQELEATVAWGLAQQAGEEPFAEESFITAALIDVPDDAPVVHILNSGHPAPLRLRCGQVDKLTPGEFAPPIGVGLAVPGAAAVDTFPFAAGDMLLLYTDGATEARDAHGRFYPLSERLALFGECGSPRELVARVRDDLLDYSEGELGDDAALVAAMRAPARPAPGP
ncbi:PP2C family protein-serine/threonine phosphatase [Actinacidiphila rubida]|uniref:Stage II sporulation protein E (SpoIIE) n=1 Tax=Actinacidiphila rubida TaxID=310780 RepID=A0A1H8LUU8_9ACTN|nr:PP2C family protein-serine/threonine phosphatase [Actinacidiphila rubida]SEO08914.1 Stage II sporulation protein E (SpoIIE) [Actinacidiphila rubida]